jgi:hypothetical protein
MRPRSASFVSRAIRHPQRADPGVPERIGIIVQRRRRGLDVQRSGDDPNAVAARVQAKHVRREGHGHAVSVDRLVTHRPAGGISRPSRGVTRGRTVTSGHSWKRLPDASPWSDDLASAPVPDRITCRQCLVWGIAARNPSPHLKDSQCAQWLEAAERCRLEKAVGIAERRARCRFGAKPRARRSEARRPARLSASEVEGAVLRSFHWGDFVVSASERCGSPRSTGCRPDARSTLRCWWRSRTASGRRLRGRVPAT